MKKHLIQLTDHFSYLEYSENDRPNIGLVIGKTGFLIIDSGNSRKCAENFLSALKKKRSQIKSKNGYLVLTHHHWDHICGAFFYEFPVFASSETCKKIKNMKKIKWTLSGIENAFQENWFYDVNKFKKMKESLLSYKADWFVESHAKPIPREKMEKWLEKILFLLEFVTEGKSLESALEVLPQQLKETSLGYDELIYSAIRNCKV